MHPVGATTNCEKNCDIIVHDSKKFSILKKGIGIEGEKIIETS